MAWIGYYVYDDIEIINTSRTEAYARNAGLDFFRPIYNNEALPLMLGATYASPLQDTDTPWADPDQLESYDFYGVYPLDVTGVEDSTVNATVTESTQDGGAVGVSRRATRAMVFSAVLIGQTECAVEYGMRWLRVALNGGGCIKQRRESNDCSGRTLEFLSCYPVLDMTYSSSITTVTRLIIDGGTAAAPGPTPVDGGSAAAPGTTVINGGNPTTTGSTQVIVPPTIDLTTCLPEYQRFFHRVTVTTGPTITNRTTTTSGAAIWTIEWTAVAADPMEYGAATPVIAGFNDPDVDDPYVGGVPDGGIWDDDGYVTVDPDCPTAIYMPVFDPTCPLLIAPPALPDIAIGCEDFPVNFTRRMFTVPQQFIPEWGETVPVVTFHTPDVDVRNLRIRFYPDSDNNQTPDDLCDYEGSILFTYLPANSTVTFDGVNHLINVDSPGFPTRRGDGIAIGSDGAPFEWPELSCGDGFVVTIDLPQTQVPPSVDLSLVPKVC